MPHTVKTALQRWYVPWCKRAAAWRLSLLPRVVLCAALLAQWGCAREIEPPSPALAGADPARGKVLMVAYGCPACHTIPGIRGADGLVGPPLDHMARRVYIAGRVPNTAENMLWWLQYPQALDRPSIMPNMGVTEAEARDMTSYLYTLR